MYQIGFKREVPRKCQYYLVSNKEQAIEEAAKMLEAGYPYITVKKLDVKKISGGI